MRNKTRLLPMLIALSMALPLAWLSAETYASEFPEPARQQALNMAAEFPRLHSIMAAHAGELVLAEAFRGPGLDTPANIKSLSKTVLSAVVGGAVDRGEVQLDQAVTELMPNRIPTNATTGIERITLANLVSMQAGLERTSGRYYGRGFGGQVLYVIPSVELTVVITSSPNPPSPGGRYLRELHEIVAQALIPAARQAM